MVVDAARVVLAMSSYQQLGSTAFSSIAASWRRTSVHDIPSLVHWFLLDVPVVPVLLGFHAFFAAASTAKPGAGKHFWFKSLVLTIFAAFGGSTLAAILSGAPAPLFTTGSNYMMGYIGVAWYLVHTVRPVREFLRLRPVAACLAFGAQAAKARSIFAFVDGFVVRFPGCTAGAVVLGGVAGSGGSLFVAFERKLRLGAAAPSELSKPGWGFKSAYLAAATYYVVTDPDRVLRDAPIPIRGVVANDTARFYLALLLCVHAFIETLVGRHINPVWLLESIFYAIFRLERNPADLPPSPIKKQKPPAVVPPSASRSIPSNPTQRTDAGRRARTARTSAGGSTEAAVTSSRAHLQVRQRRAATAAQCS